MRARRMPGIVLMLSSGAVLVYLCSAVLGTIGADPPPPCVLTPVGGVVTLPPVGCGYLSFSEIHVLVAGLPPDTTIVAAAGHGEWTGVNRTYLPDNAEEETFNSTLTFELTGTGSLTGFNRTVVIPNVAVETYLNHSPTSQPVQVIATDLHRIEGGILGDPDFQHLTISAGSELGLPCPGQTTLTMLTATTWDVDSFFDVAYTLDFAGAPGSMLDGFAGATSGVVRMQVGTTPPPEVPDGTFGSAMRVAKLDAAGSTLGVEWDRTTCLDATDNQIVWGYGSQLPASLGGVYGLSGSACAIGVTTPHTWSGVPDPGVDSTRYLWFLVLATDGSQVEGPWGRDSAGGERSGTGAGGASSQCGIAAKSLVNSCGI